AGPTGERSRAGGARVTMPVNGCSTLMFRERLARLEADHPKKPEGHKMRVGYQGSQQLSASALDPDHPLGRAHRLGAEDGSKRFRGLPRRRLGTLRSALAPRPFPAPPRSSEAKVDVGNSERVAAKPPA